MYNYVTGRKNVRLCNNEYLKGVTCLASPGSLAASSLAGATGCSYGNCPYTGGERAANELAAFKAADEYPINFRRGKMYFAGTNIRVPRDWDGHTPPEEY